MTLDTTDAELPPPGRAIAAAPGSTPADPGGPSPQADPAAGESHVDQGRLFSYRPALDGLRAFAVVAVLLYHGSQLTRDPVTVLPGGFLGVDLFFVLSGFLITTLLAREWRKTDTIRFKAFWGRRMRRLLPALVLVVGLVGVAFLFAEALNFTGSQISHYPKDALSSLFYVANWNSALSGQSYFDQFGGASPLRHMWSLAIEEQFYLVWPVLVYLALRVARIPTRVFAVLALAGAVASATAMAVMFDPAADPSRIYYGTDTRAQAMLVGACVALLLIGARTGWLGGRIAQIVGVASLAGCVVMFALVSDDAQRAGWMYQGGFFLMAVLAVGAITVASGPQGTLFTRALAWRPLVWIGMLSYGLYLWHWPIFVLLDSERTGLGGVSLLGLRLAVTFVVAAISYRFVEAPIRFGTWRHGVRAPLTLVAAGLCVVVIATSVVVVRPSASDQALLDAAAASPGGNPLPDVKPGQTKVLMTGDSQPFDLLALRAKRTPDPFAFLSDAQIGCSISGIDSTRADGRPDRVAGDCTGQLAIWKGDVNRFDPDVVMMLFGAWEVFDRAQNGEVVKVGTPKWDQMKLAEMNQAFKVLTAKGATLMMVTSPCFGALNPNVVTQPEVGETWRTDRYNAVVRKFAAQHPQKVVVADLHKFLCPGGTFTGQLNGVQYTNDGVHVNKAGAPLVWTWLENQLKKVKRSGR